MDFSYNHITACLAEDSEQVIKGKGQNIIPPPEKEPLWKGFLMKFTDPLIIILLIVFVFSVGASLYEYYSLGREAEVLLEPLGVFIALMLATGVGFLFEVKAAREFDVLNKVKDSRPVKVVRLRRGADGTSKAEVMEIPKSDVVVGDVVRLESGDEVPADGTVLEAIQLKVDESVFTGETYADKDSKPSENEDTAYPANFLLRGSTVIEGNAFMVATACGTSTEECKCAIKVQEGSDVKTPLDLQLAHLGKSISVISMVIGAVIILARLTYFFFEIADIEGILTDENQMAEAFEYTIRSLMIAVTLVVVAVPEGLPMSITLSLALSMRRMLKENNLVRKLHACETMGAATVICTDKTGTLTKNQMTVMEHQFFGTTPMELVAQAIAVNSTAEITREADGTVTRIGNPTECALLMWIESQGYDYKALRRASVIRQQKPFSTNTKYMETVTADGHTFLKGASEILLDQCSSIAGDMTREQIFDSLHSYQSKAMRTLGFAIDGVFVGIVGIADPVRDDVAEAIDVCYNHAGVRVIIVTGDTPGTACEIGRQIGLVTDTDTHPAITGSEFAAMTDREARQLLALRGKNAVKVISRARPEDKARLVTLLQRNGEVVAVTGDGTNDAPALSKAHVGLSMGDGTSRAKEASDITIIDNSFSSINKAILWGRSLYQNIRRFILFQTTINVCACFMVLIGAFTGAESPLGVTQMLWVNLIMDTFAAMALSSLPADENVLNAPPRLPKSNIIDVKMALTISLSGCFFFFVLCYVWLYLPHEYFFTVFVCIQFWNIFNARYYNTRDSFIGNLIRLMTNPKSLRGKVSANFLIITLVIIVGQVLMVTYGGKMFEIERALTFDEWKWILIFTSPVLFAPDVVRYFQSK